MTQIELAPLCTCGQPGPIGIAFTDPVSGRAIVRRSCGNHFTDRIWAALMQAGPVAIVVQQTEMP